ncbi:glycoside hydrolase family 127 protein [Mucilaginibacter pedocola]|uniref:Six-hairpin glycosidase n=1 Tax=Mucilaginibacter pedocola TaxID=1792845 RepID=A0A1S9P9R9_9SPHI|nr:beta-L-arabinofuranosidase domain-containing protein [Mucilaginibacter pedocola]OOQ57724.1 six-hairpin glycosidase [Mucilaginibacter pedocola]
MAFFKRHRIALVCSQLALLSLPALAQTGGKTQIITPLTFQQVRIDDSFWSPKLKVWTSKTVYDVFDKLEGKYVPDRPDIIAEKEKLGRTRNAFLNFDEVAKGKVDTKTHDGPPWYDGLVYETIRGAADLLAEHPDPTLQKKIDAYIDRIAAAQAADPDGYINTYTTLTRPTMRWGTNGGSDTWQHDCYNAGMLVEAAVHYYNATGETKLLTVAVKLSNYMYKVMGPYPKLNVVPGHGGPEEALIKLYWLFKQNPALKSKVGAPVEEQQYFDLAKFWIEARGDHGNADGTHKRENLKAYDQDDKSVFEQKTIEGHAVRATLFATGVTTAALENKDPKYILAANTLWDNMIGKKLFITGGEGAIHDEEKFGPNYFLPENAYGETCASISSAFFSGRMNELEADGKYMDEFERVAYNNLLSGVSLSGEKYFYENPLVGNGNKRWAWHDCPCCPPMILKMIGVLPQYIYAQDAKDVYVNLFIGSEATVKVADSEVLLNQSTQYPWKGDTKITVSPAVPKNFTVKVRIPGWAQGKENPYGLYTSNSTGRATLKVNGVAMKVQPVNGYAVINRKWKKGDAISLSLPMAPRVVTANDSVQSVKSKLAIASGPVLYSFETIDNPSLASYKVSPNTPMVLTYKPNLLNGVNVVTGKAVNEATGKTVDFTAVPFYTLGNRELGAPYQVWIPEKAK